jgi:hypothetical protein
MYGAGHQVEETDAMLNNFVEAMVLVQVKRLLQ